VTNVQRLHRDPDPRVHRSLRVAIACALCVVAAALGVVAVRVQQVHLAYQLDALRAEHGRAETLIRQLEVEVATLRSPRRIEAQARQLGLIAPAPQQIQIAREFVAPRSGRSAAGSARIEAHVR
jgi:cell division protein FtsL